MWKIFDSILWGTVMLVAFGCWFAVVFFDWEPSAKWVATIAFLGWQTAANAMLRQART